MLRGLALLLLSWLLDLPGTLMRMLLFIIVGTIIGLITHSGWWVTLAILLALWPTFGVLLALAFPSGHLLTRWQQGARDPSGRERQAVEQAFATLGEKGVAPPQHWYVVDAPTVNAYVIGSALYIERELIWSSFLPAVLAHELGHLNTSDGRYILATRRLVLPMFLRMAEGFAQTGQRTFEIEAVTGRTKPFGMTGCGFILWAGAALLMGGGLSLLLLRPLWLAYWRDREYAADAYAAGLGQAESFTEALQSLSLALDMAAPFMWGRTHPYTESRIGRLIEFAHTAPPPLPAPLRPLLWRSVPTSILLAVLVPFLWFSSSLNSRPSVAASAPPRKSTTVVTVAATSTPRQEATARPSRTPKPQATARSTATPQAQATPNTGGTIQAAVQATGEAAGLLPSVTLTPSTAPTTDPIQAAVQATVAALQAAALEVNGSPQQINPTAALAQGFGAPQPLRPDRVTASHTAPDGQDSSGARVSYDAANVVDGKLDTAWRVPGTGIGESITLTYNAPILVREIDIVPGYAEIDLATGIDRFKENRRVRRVRIELGDETSLEAELADDAVLQRIQLPRPATTTFVRVVVLVTTEHGGAGLHANQ